MSYTIFIPAITHPFNNKLVSVIPGHDPNIVMETSEATSNPLKSSFDLFIRYSAFFIFFGKKQQLFSAVEKFS